MANRYISTGYYKSPFIRGLKGSLKGLYSYIICDCSGSGIWIKDLPIASAYIGFEIKESDFDVFIEKGKAVDLLDGKFFFPDFIEHQYPKGLSATNPAHNNFILELNKYKLLDENLKVLPSPLKGTKVMVTVMEKVDVKEKVNAYEENFLDPTKKVKVIEYFDKSSPNYQPPKIKPELIYPFTSENFMQAWGVLVKEKKWKKKSFDALQASLHKLAKVSEGDAIEMMMNCIAGEWQGLVELKNNQNGKAKSKFEQNAEAGREFRASFNNS